MSWLNPKNWKTLSVTPEDLTLKEVKERTYAIFQNSGVEVDLAEFFRSESGKEAVRDITQGITFYNPVPRRGLPPAAQSGKTNTRGD